MAVPTSETVPGSASKSRRRRPYRLWPLLFLPFLGALAGVGAHRWLGAVRESAGGSSMNDIAMDAAFGFLVGTDLMIAAAACFAIYRAARRRFKIRSILILVAAVAVFLTLARAVLF